MMVKIVCQCCGKVYVFNPYTEYSQQFGICNDCSE
jgi:hypothetical protein